MKIRLTKRSVDALLTPDHGETVVWDDQLAGFGLRLSSTGRRTYFVHKRTKAGRQVRVKLGVHGEVTTDQAREFAGRELARIAGGADPVDERRRLRAEEEKRRLVPTVAQLADNYLLEHVEVHCRTRSATEYRSLIENHIKPKLGNIKVPDLEHGEIANLHRELGKTPVAANRTIAVLSQLLNFGIRTQKLRSDNPSAGIRRYPEEKRQRFLSAAELGRLAQALGEHPFKISAAAMRLLLLTGARRSEVMQMTWQQVETDPGHWIKPAAFTKQKREHRVPLSPGALVVIAEMQKFRKTGEPFVFPGRSPGEHLTEIKKSWRSVCKTAGIAGARMHDLRHSYASMLASGGLSLPVIGALLGHTQPSTTQRYAHLADDPLQEATNRVDALLTALAADRKAEVTPLRKRPS